MISPVAFAIGGAIGAVIGWRLAEYQRGRELARIIARISPVLTPLDPGYVRPRPEFVLVLVEVVKAAAIGVVLVLAAILFTCEVFP